MIEFICLNLLLVKDRCSLFLYTSRNKIGKVSVQSFIDDIAIEIQLISIWKLPLLSEPETSHLLDTETECFEWLLSVRKPTHHPLMSLVSVDPPLAMARGEISNQHP
ncbi:hypothetical protein PMIT1303_00962 [Prochlorococcus sp. MIT 1303]|nr:hypothetical protein PMIT1303_00962 [Prochlorococcus sp. MIT 1303]